MTNHSKARGTAWESSVRDFLNEALGQYHPDWRQRREDGLSPFINPRDPNNITRTVQTGARDTGDLALWPAIGECKDEKEHDFPGYIRQANREALAAGAEYGVAFVKKRRANVADGYAVMDLRTFARVLAALRR